MKVLMFSNLVPCKTGAFEHFLAALGARLRELGDECVCVFAGDPIPEVAGWFDRSGMRWRAIAGWTASGENVRPWRFVVPALRAVAEEKPDIVAINFGNELPAVTARVLARLTAGSRARWVWQQHQMIGRADGLRARVSRIRLVGMAFDRVVSLYEGGLASLRERMLDPCKLCVIPNGIAETVSSSDGGSVRMSLGIEPEAVVAMTIGSLIPRKRIGFQIAAVARVKRPLHLLVCGEGPEVHSLRLLADGLGVAGRVHWLGKRNDVPQLLRQSDILLHSALAEASPYAVLEAMAAGLPVVATSSGAIPEQVANGVSGFVVGPDDIEGFVSHINLLCADRTRRSQMGREARLRWQKEFTEDLCVNRYTALYRSLSCHTA